MHAEEMGSKSLKRYSLYKRGNQSKAHVRFSLPEKKNFACLNAGKVALRTYTVVKSMNAPELYMNASVVNSLCCLSREAKKMLNSVCKSCSNILRNRLSIPNNKDGNTHAHLNIHHDIKCRMNHKHH